MISYDALRKKWPDLGEPSLPEEVVADALARMQAGPPAEPTVTHWVNPITPEQKAETKQHEDWIRDQHAWQQSWAAIFNHPAVLAKLATLNAPPTVEVQRRNRDRFVLVGADDKGRSMFEHPLESVQVPGESWWHQNGHTSPVSPSDLVNVFIETSGKIALV